MACRLNALSSFFHLAPVIIPTCLGSLTLICLLPSQMVSVTQIELLYFSAAGILTMHEILFRDPRTC